MDGISFQKSDMSEYKSRELLSLSLESLSLPKPHKALYGVSVLFQQKLLLLQLKHVVCLLKQLVPWA